MAVVATCSAAAFTFAMGCSYDWGVDEATAPALASPAPMTAATDADAYAPALDASRHVSDARADARDADGEDAANACSPSHACPTGSYCRYADHFCGSGRAGQCEALPASCADASVSTSCGCDGEIHASSCVAAKGGVDVSSQAPCDPPADAYRCGYRFCTSDEYCAVDHPGTQDDYRCEPLNGCGLGCVCLQSLQCAGGSCAVENGHVVVRCP